MTYIRVVNSKLLYVLSSCVLLALLSCGWLTGPDDDEVDPLNFTWTVDTLAYPDSYQTTMRRIWGSSPDDVYVVGHNEAGPGKMYHFDGKEWSDVGLNPVQGGHISGPIDLEDIYGFGPNDIWAVGEHFHSNPDPPPNILDSTLIIHYDGTGWWESDTLKDRVLTSIGGKGPDDFWVGGLDGIIYHYDGTSFQRDSVPVPIVPEAFAQFSDFVGREGTPDYALMRAPQGDPITSWDYLLEYQDGKWRVLDSVSGRGWNNLWLSPRGRLYATGVSRLDHWEGGIRTTLLDSIDLDGIAGTSEDDLYVIGAKPGTSFNVAVYHFNGTEWRRLPVPELGQVDLAGIWTDGREVFVLGGLWDMFPQSTLILHGR